MCGHCRLKKPLDEFSMRFVATGERQPWCRQCMAEYKRDWYVRNRSHQLSRVRANKDRTTQENQARVWAYLGQNPCVDCGESDPVVLQFDHRHHKRMDVSDMPSGGFSWGTIQTEIEKCDVRCGNCHRRKTARELGLYERKRTFVRVEETTAIYS